MKKNLALIILLSLLNTNHLFAQVSKKIIVEHFTNTNCGICGSRNPGFYTNLSSQSNVLHLAVHPSSPYKSCQLYKDNPVTNDERTKFYGIYGATPRLVINGSVISSSSNYANASIFTPFEAQTSPVSIRIVQEKVTDSIKVNVIIKNEASHSLGELLLFVALAEDTVFYKGNNGEAQHYDVFRESLTKAEGLKFTLPAKMGDSIMFDFKVAANSIWNFSRIYPLAILQEASDKNLVQAEALEPIMAKVTTGNKRELSTLKAMVYPNPLSNSITINLDDATVSTVKIFSMNGKLVLEKMNFRNEISLEMGDLPNGVYFIRIINSKGSFIQKLVKE